MAVTDWGWFIVGTVAAAVAVPFVLLDWRKVDRGGYVKKYGSGYRRGVASLWMLPACLFGFIAIYCFKEAFRVP